MRMASRVVRAFDELVAAERGVPRDTTAILGVITHWLSESLPKVSRTAAEILTRDPGVQRLVATDPCLLPTTPKSVMAFFEGIRRCSSRDPATIASLVGGLAWDLGVFANPDEVCPECQATQTLWAAPGVEMVWRCDLLDCTFSLSGDRLALEAHLSPALRPEVVACFPHVDLLRLSG